MQTSIAYTHTYTKHTHIEIQTYIYRCIQIYLVSMTHQYTYIHSIYMNTHVHMCAYIHKYGHLHLFTNFPWNIVSECVSFLIIKFIYFLLTVLQLNLRNLHSMSPRIYTFIFKKQVYVGSVLLQYSHYTHRLLLLTNTVSDEVDKYTIYLCIRFL